MQLPDIENPKPPKGKRSIRETVYGNTNAYVSGRFWKTLGETYGVGTKNAVEAWLDGTDNQ